MQHCSKSSYDTSALNFQTLVIMKLMQKCNNRRDINKQSSYSLLYPL